MEPKEQRMKELLTWLEIKGVEVNAWDIKTLESIISLATNDGYRAAAEVTRQTLEDMRR